MLVIHVQESAGKATVDLKGVMDEFAVFDKLQALQSQSVAIGCKGVDRINSVGVKRWRELFSELRAKGMKFKFREVAPCLMNQACSIADFILADEIDSVCCPFRCDNCDEERVIVIASQDHSKIASGQISEICSQCKSPMEFDEIPDKYFAVFQSQKN
jgi:hypothetical protein